jgi:hypothetical protein
MQTTVSFSKSIFLQFDGWKHQSYLAALQIRKNLAPDRGNVYHLESNKKYEGLSLKLCPEENVGRDEDDIIEV